MGGPEPTCDSLTPMTGEVQRWTAEADSAVLARMLSLLVTLLVTAPPALPAPSVTPQWLGKPPARGAAPERIVTLSPALLEWVYALGAGDRVVGVSRYADAPEAAKLLPRVGGLADPNAEAILALKPDLVLVSPVGTNRRVLSQLAGLGLPVFVVPASTMADAFHALRAVGVALGRQRRAAALELDLRARLKALTERAAALPSVRALVVFSWNPIVAAGPGSMIDALLARANADNVIKSGVNYPHISLETVVARAPDVIFALHGAPPPGLVQARFSVVELSDTTLLRAGPRVDQALAKLIALLAPYRKAGAKARSAPSPSAAAAKTARP